MEENISAGGYGERLAAAAVCKEYAKNIQLLDISIKTGSVEQGDVRTLRNVLRIDAESVYKVIKEHNF
jgi:deoxyxylulose-5-phosphate synthase